MATGSSEAKPSSESISTQNSGINMFLPSLPMDTNNSQKTAIVVVLFVYSILSNVEIRFRNRNPTWHTLAEKCRYLTGFLVSILVASIRVPILLWIGLAIWAIVLAAESYFLNVEFRGQLLNAVSRVTDVLIWRPTGALRMLGQSTMMKLLGAHKKIVSPVPLAYLMLYCCCNIFFVVAVDIILI